MGEFVSKLLTTLITVVIAVGGSAVVWIGANLIFNQVKRSWHTFSAMALGVSGFFVAMLLSGNRVTRYSGPADSWYAKFGYWVWFPLVVALAAGVLGWFIGRTDDRGQRLALGAGGLGSLGVFAGAMTREEYYPDFELLPVVVWPLVVAAVGAGLNMLRKRPPVTGALTGAAIGWIVGAWGVPDLGNDGSQVWAIIALGVAPALVGARIGYGHIPNATERSLIDHRSRAVVFIGPAVLFIFAMLVVPAVLTLVLSFQDRRSEEYVGFENFRSIFNDPNSLDLGDWADMFTSRLFIIGAILLIVFAILGARGKQQTGKFVELGSPSSGPLVIGGLLVIFAAFTAMRGTIINNLWWVVVVTLFSTSIGLAIAVLADGARFERVAKSIIFMPMAISLVGASVIWRFMYVARDTSQNQTGVMNGLWVGLGQLSTGLGIAATTFVFLIIFVGVIFVINQIAKHNWVMAAAGIVATPVAGYLFAVLWNALGDDGTRWLVGILLTIVFLATLALLGQALVRQEFARAVLPGVMAIALGWFLARYWAIWGAGVGGHRVNDEGIVTSGEAINFIQEGPFNNVWLMVVLIWIQTGFAMVILSAAIKAVPTELIEAARVDGATESQVFWRVTLPQIATTIGVVVTTLIVLVMKVYDIVKVMTNGNFGSEVLANAMFREAFLNLDAGRGAALAMLILVSVLPIMIMNIRRMQREG